MDWLTFISKAIESLAWPVIAFVIVGMLKDEIKKLLPFIKKFKAGPVEAEFERDVAELKKSADKATLLESPDTASKAFLIQLAELHPRSSILESWVRLEAAARLALANKTADYSKSNYLPAAKLGNPLEKAGLISNSQVNIYENLRRLRNEIAHDMNLEPNVEAARTYIELASLLQGQLEAAVQNA